MIYRLPHKGQDLCNHKLLVFSLPQMENLTDLNTIFKSEMAVFDELAKSY